MKGMKTWSGLKRKKNNYGERRRKEEEEGVQADLEKVIVAVSLEASRLPDIVVQPPEILHLSFTSHHTHTHYLRHPTP